MWWKRPLLRAFRCWLSMTVQRMALPNVLTGLPVKLIRHPRNRGKGAALRTGFAWALENGFAGVVTLDSDGQHDPIGHSLSAGGGT